MGVDMSTGKTHDLWRDKNGRKEVKKNKKSTVWEERRVGEADEQEHNDKKKQEAKEEKPTKPNKTDSMRRMAYIWNQ